MKEAQITGTVQQLQHAGGQARGGGGLNDQLRGHRRPLRGFQ